MKTAAEVREQHAKIICDAIDSEMSRINTIIEQHIKERNKENTVAVELDTRTASMVLNRLHILGYLTRVSEFDPREPQNITYTYISW